MGEIKLFKKNPLSLVLDIAKVMKAPLLILTILLNCFVSLSQEADSLDITDKPAKEKKEKKERIKADNSPIIGFGVGTIGFYGDLNDKDYGTPFGSNVAFNVNLIQPVTDFLNVRFDFLLGSIREEERSLQRNLNFETNIISGALFVEYNFDHFLSAKRRITPFVTSGIGVVEFNTKSDLLSASGDPYNYWTDGTIRNIAEDAENAESAEIIRRDYNYETDLRDAGFNESNQYAEQAFMIPVGVGVTMHLNNQFDFRFQSTMYLTFSDYIDGVSRSTRPQFLNGKGANANNDHFLVSGASLSYNFQKVKGAEELEFDSYDKTPINYLATGNTEDFDGDGVIDLIDVCPNTPADVEVDTVGCPVDTDGDGVPDYLDEEINSEFPQFANEKGVEMTDDMIYRSYLRYIDSTRELTEVIERNFRGSFAVKKAVKYRVQVGNYQKGSTPEDMSSLLTLSDLNKLDQDDKTLYTVGKYQTYVQAKRRAEELQKEGYSDAVVLERNRKGKYVPIVIDSPSGDAVNPANNTTKQENIDPDLLVFRVQLGAFKAKPTSQKYKEIPNLFVVESGGYYRYMSGSFDNFNDAAKHKVKMVIEGYKGAFVVAYKGGKRVPLKSVGVNPITSDPIIGK